jgi:hypothetical protein
MATPRVLLHDAGHNGRLAGCYDRPSNAPPESKGSCRRVESGLGLQPKDRAPRFLDGGGRGVGAFPCFRQQRSVRTLPKDASVVKSVLPA